MPSASTAPPSGCELRERLGGACAAARPRPNITSRPIPRACRRKLAGDRRPALRRPADRRLFVLAQLLSERAKSPSSRSRPKRRRPLPPSPPRRSPRPARPVTLTATGEVWLRVTDGPGGPQLFSGSLNAGQTYTVPATAQRPLIRTGRPQLLRASAGGRDLGPLAPEERVISDVSLLAQDLAARAQPGPAPAAPGRPSARARTLLAARGRTAAPLAASTVFGREWAIASSRIA